MKEHPFTYYLFGSKTSQDYDLLFILKELPDSIIERLNLSKTLSNKVVDFFSDKPINANLAVCEKGQITQVYKGTPDELNNALFTTYNLHVQAYPNPIKKLTQRNKPLKYLRASRMILSFISKTTYRPLVKKGLKGTIEDKIQSLKEIDLSLIDDFGPKTNKKDLQKSIAFQLGQSLALAQGIECYTKEQLSLLYPDLHPFLNRENQPHKNILESYKKQFIMLLEKEKSKIPPVE